MSNETEKPETNESAAERTGEESEETPATDGEFQITIRKLTLPVRPRGVLAE